VAEERSLCSVLARRHCWQLAFLAEVAAQVLVPERLIAWVAALALQGAPVFWAKLEAVCD
jgi:hypothetical protein